MDWPLRALSFGAPHATPSRLLDLPAELRTYIFELAVTSDLPLVAFRLDSYQADSLREATQPALTRVSKQLRRESLLLFYSSNTFILHTEGHKANHGHRWAQCTEPYLRELTSIEVRQRVVTLTNARSESNGALAVTMTRAKADSPWRVGDHWKWASVTPKPNGVSIDASFILGLLRTLVMEDAGLLDTADNIFATVTDLRSLYVKEKMS